MATAIQRRRGTTTQHGSFTGLAGEITIDTTKFTAIATAPNPSGEIPNHQSLFKLGIAEEPPSKTPNLNFRI